MSVFPSICLRQSIAKLIESVTADKHSSIAAGHETERAFEHRFVGLLKASFLNASCRFFNYLDCLDFHDWKIVSTN
jgi:hypothetical protein